LTVLHEAMSVDQSANKLLDLETELLSHLLDKADLEFVAREGITVDLIYTPKHQKIFNFMMHYYQEYNAAPTLEVMSVEWPDFVIAERAATIEWTIDKLRERYQKNKVQDMLYAIADRANDPTAALDYLTQQTLEIQRNSISQRNVWAAGDSDFFLQNLQDKIMAGHYNGVTLGWEPVDTFTGGLRNGQLAFVAARPKRMKTFFMLKAFIEQKRQGAKPIFYTLENSEEEIMLRISCMLSGYPWDLAQRGVIDSNGWKLLKNTWDNFNSLGEHWIARPPFEERTVPSMQLQADKLGADSILISQFKWIMPSNNHYLYRPDHEKWASIVMDLKLASSRPGSERPIYVEAQFNREGESIEEFTEIGLSQLGLTDAMGQVADIVFALYQNKDMRDQQQIQFGIIDSRNTDKNAWYVHTEFKKATRMEML
jgi:hypothetical protein